MLYISMLFVVLLLVRMFFYVIFLVWVGVSSVFVQVNVIVLVVVIFRKVFIWLFFFVLGGLVLCFCCFCIFCVVFLVQGVGQLCSRFEINLVVIGVWFVLVCSRCVVCCKVLIEWGVLDSVLNLFLVLFRLVVMVLIFLVLVVVGSVFIWLCSVVMLLLCLVILLVLGCVLIQVWIVQIVFWLRMF